MILRLLVCISILLVPSCAIYKPCFDCPPGKGVPCTAVSDIEKMIIETGPDKPDIFVAEERLKDCHELHTMGAFRPRRSKECHPRKIWVEEYVTEDGCLVEGHYVYFVNEEKRPC